MQDNIARSYTFLEMRLSVYIKFSSCIVQFRKSKMYRFQNFWGGGKIEVF